MNMFIAGGGGRNLVVLGALHYLIRYEKLRIQKVWGISSGSVVASGCAMALSPLDLFRRMIKHSHWLTGIPNVGAFVRAVFPSPPSIQAHQRLAVLAYDVRNDEIVERNRPDYFYEALEESCGIPPITASHCAQFVDAGIVDNIPFHLVPSREPAILWMSQVVGESPLSWSFWLNVSGRRRPAHVPLNHSLFILATPEYAFFAQSKEEMIALFMIGFTQMARAFNRACVNERTRKH